MKLLVLTASLGDRPFAQYTLDSMQKYADRIGADFKSITEFQRGPEYDSIVVAGGRQSVFIDKLLIIQRELKEYDRVIWMDDTCLVSSDTPNLFDIVPYELFGAHNEGTLDWVTCAHSTIEKFKSIKEFDVIVKQCYFNAGMMVISKAHEHLFADALIIRLGEAGFMNDAYVDQTYLNLLVRKLNVPFFALPNIFNRMAVMVENFEGEKVNYETFKPRQTYAATRINNFSFLNKKNTAIGGSNGAYIYHITSIYSTEQRTALLKKLYEIKVDK